MPIIKSAQKRVRTARKATIRNLKVKRTMKTAIKALDKVVKSGKKSAGDEYSEAASAIDTAAKKGIIHKNKAARQKSRLAKQMKKAGVSTAGSSKKTSVKKPTAKKSPAKKTAAKKPAAKKPAPKKSSKK
jgi:small subunit ribosomal protein S20